MDPDAAVGQRLADLRKQKELRQEDFLALLEARGVAWTQTTLSRVEGGKRVLKATELFAVADALGAEPEQLNPAGGSLFYQVQSFRLRYQEAKAAARRANRLADELKARLVALTLANELSEGRSNYVVRGGANQFVDLLGRALSPNENSWRIAEGLDLIDIREDDMQQEFETLAAERFPETNPSEMDGDDHYALEGEAYAIVFGRRYPDLKFEGPPDEGQFSVDGLEVEPIRPRSTAEGLIDLFEDLDYGG